MTSSIAEFYHLEHGKIREAWVDRLCELGQLALVPDARAS
jgi:hypothetical protein